ncbi:MAG TPA: BTAD domain-containing putative transcriptional regulator, partial [Acidimicrobiales bacterium]|nr:BTAD domain-containing putative transcriptional regulator [Acidimicrobiales bacterium]
PAPPPPAPPEVEVPAPESSAATTPAPTDAESPASESPESPAPTEEAPAPAPPDVEAESDDPAVTVTTVGELQAGGELPEDHQDDERQEDGAFPVGLVAGGIGVAGLVIALDRARRAQLRRRRPRQAIALPGPELAHTESVLRAGADVDGARLVDAALRAAAATAGSAGLPPFRWVEATPDEVVLVLADAAAPSAGFVAEAPDRWRTAVGYEQLAAAGSTVAAPAPLLSVVGATAGGAEVLVDLESHGVVTVAADHDRGTAWLRAVAVSVATAPWAVQPRVLLVGLDDGLARLPSIEAVDTGLGDALDLAEAHASRIDALLTGLACGTTAQARAAGATPDAWEPLLVVSAVPPHELDLARLRALAARRGRSVAVVCPQGDVPAVGTLCRIDGAGLLRLEGVDTLVLARGLDPHAVAAVELLEHAEQAEPVDLPTRDPVPTHPTQPDTDPPPRLDDLLVRADVLVRVLGEVQVVQRQDDGTEAPLAVGRQKGLEAICYLALREATVDREDLEIALFPSGAHAVKTFQNAVTAARKALTERLFPAPEGGRYALDERVTSDYALFAQLAEHAEATDDPVLAAELLAEALTLVTGEPFTGAGRGFGWIGPHRGAIVAQVVDAADELAEIRLEAGDWRGAEWAARQGLRAFPCDERMYRILMRSAHAAGNVPGVHRAYRELCTAVADPDDGVEPHDSVHPETVALLEQLTSRAPRTSTA